MNALQQYIQRIVETHQDEDEHKINASEQQKLFMKTLIQLMTAFYNRIDKAKADSDIDAIWERHSYSDEEQATVLVFKPKDVEYLENVESLFTSEQNTGGEGEYTYTLGAAIHHERLLHGYQFEYIIPSLYDDRILVFHAAYNTGPPLFCEIATSVDKLHSVFKIAKTIDELNILLKRWFNVYTYYDPDMGEVYDDGNGEEE